MTAIAGVCYSDGRSPDKILLTRIESVLKPYGIDHQAVATRGRCGVVRVLSRLSPEDQQDQQPVQTVQGDLVLFDGRLDYRLDLINKLALSRGVTTQMSDSALAACAWERWNTHLVEHLEGDFAIAVCRPSTGEAWLFRDHFGHRPLFWTRQQGMIAFATLPKALFCIPGVVRELCEERVADFLALLPQRGPESFYKNIWRVEPGHWVHVTPHGHEARHYYRLDTESELQLGSDNEYVEAFREHLDAAVATRLRSNGKFATHLSSGFDSSTVTAVTARLLAQRGESLIAYTAAPRDGFDGAVPSGRHADESIGAHALVQRFDNIEHVIIRPDGTSPIELLGSQIESLDRAPLNPCNMVWMDAIHRDAESRGVKALLTGQMGNMSISYSGDPRLANLWSRLRWTEWWQEVAAQRREPINRRMISLLYQSWAPFLPIWSHTLINLLRNRQGYISLNNYSAINPTLERKAQLHQRARNLDFDLSYRPWSDGRKLREMVVRRMDNGDHFTQINLHGLEMRDPTGDKRLFEFCMQVPDRQFQYLGQDRWLLRRAMAGILPPEITDAKTKGLQAADWYEETTASLPRLRDALSQLSAHGRAGEFLDLVSLEQLLDHWPTSGWAQEEVIRSYRIKLLRGLAVGQFIRYAEPSNSRSGA